MQAALTQALTLESEKRLVEADQLYRNILKTEPKNGVAMYRRAVLASQRNEHDEAVRIVQSALEHVPKSIRDRANADFGRILMRHADFVFEEGRIEEAVASYAQATTFLPDNAQAHFFEALGRLTLGDFAKGWHKYEWRWKAYGDAPNGTNVGRSLWTGSQPLAGKSIFIGPEQGMGDAIMFVRYARLLARRGAKVILGGYKPLREMFGTLEDVTVVMEGDQFTRTDYQCSMLDLPGAFKTDLSNIPAEVPYLRTIASYDDKWRGVVLREKRLRVGLVWAGGHQFERDDKRSIKLADLTPLLDAADIQFVSLQREVRDYDAVTLAARPDILHFGERLENFADTASIIAQLDLVISVDTSVAHLAGALGKPLWVMLPYVPDFRWMLKRTDSPWYPTATLFRQQTLGDWEGVIARLKTALETFNPAQA